MSIWMFWKLFGDACLYFSVIGALPALFVHDFSFLWPALLCGVGGAAASSLANRGHDHLTWLGLLLPLLSLGFATEFIEFVLLIPLLIYVAMVVIRGDFALEYLSFRAFFRKSILIWSIGFGLLCLASAVEGIANPWGETVSYEETLYMGVFYAVSGIILQRQLRMGMSGSKGDRRLNSLQSAAVFGGTAAVLGGVWLLQQLLLKNAQDAMNTLGEVLLSIISLPLALVVSVLTPFMKKITEHAQVTEATEGTVEEVTAHVVAPVTGEAATVPSAPVQTAGGYPWWLAVLILSVLLILLLTVLKLHRSKAVTGSDRSVFEKLQPQGRRAGETRATNRAKVRKYYREHLKLEKRRGVRLETKQTSADILEKVSPTTDKNAAAGLREVYLKARYDETCAVTNEDVQRAKDAIRKLR